MMSRGLGRRTLKAIRSPKCFMGVIDSRRRALDRRGQGLGEHGWRGDSGFGGLLARRIVRRVGRERGSLGAGAKSAEQYRTEQAKEPQAGRGPHTFSIPAFPSRPLGRTSSTAISTTKM